MRRGAFDRLAWLALTVVITSCAFDPGPVGSGGDGSVVDARGKDAIGIDGQCGWGYTPEGGYDTCRSDWGGPLVLDMVGVYQLDVDNGLFTQPDASATTLALATAYGGGAGLLPLEGLEVRRDVTLRLLGSRRFVIAVDGDVTIEGTIDASAVGSMDGPGGGACSEGGTGATGGIAVAGTSGAGGGGGGGFGAAGGLGGNGTDATGSGGMPGTLEDNAVFPLRGGCRGGDGGAPADPGDGMAGLSGGAGGAVQISARRTLTIHGGEVRANGGGGQSGIGEVYPDDSTTPFDGDTEAGGGGGGSGGGILLEGVSVAVLRDESRARDGVICANGGSGGSGAHGADAPPTGIDGLCDIMAATTDPGAGNSGDGGDGGFLTIPPGQGGGPGAGGQKGAGGGGGGGVGRIRIRLQEGSVNTATCSPDPQTSR